MTARIAYRTAAVLLLAFAALHTFGFLTFRPQTAEGQAVLAAMNQVHFQGFSYGGFYVGFGLFVTLYLAFSAFLAWHLGDLATRAPHAIGLLGWMFFSVQLINLVLSWNYFSIKPALFSALVSCCLGWGALAAQRRRVPAV